MRKAKFVSDWHTLTLAQTALAYFIDDGGFARHLRRANRIYHERHDMLIEAVSRDFADHLELMPSTTGLHIAALARTASARRIADVTHRAAGADVEIQTLSQFAVRGIERAGIVLGFGAIQTALIGDGLRRLRKCFDK